jgi:hypothetical protein
MDSVKSNSPRYEKEMIGNANKMEMRTHVTNYGLAYIRAIEDLAEHMKTGIGFPITDLSPEQYVGTNLQSIVHNAIKDDMLLQTVQEDILDLLKPTEYSTVIDPQPKAQIHIPIAKPTIIHPHVPQPDHNEEVVVPSEHIAPQQDPSAASGHLYVGLPTTHNSTTRENIRTTDIVDSLGAYSGVIRRPSTAAPLHGDYEMNNNRTNSHHIAPDFTKRNIKYLVVILAIGAMVYTAKMKR